MDLAGSSSRFARRTFGSLSASHFLFAMVAGILGVIYTSDTELAPVVCAVLTLKTPLHIC